MTRTFLFFWVFSLPMVLINDNDQIVEVLVLMFFCTYGFLGLEYVSMELDDPYGDDPNDFPGQYVAYENMERKYEVVGALSHKKNTYSMYTDAGQRLFTRTFTFARTRRMDMKMPPSCALVLLLGLPRAMLWKTIETMCQLLYSRFWGRVVV